jgi:hypothetical protein
MSGYLMTFDDQVRAGCLGTSIRNFVGSYHGFAINHAAASSAQFAISGHACIAENVA